MSCKTELLSLIILSCLDVTLVLGGITLGEMACGPGGYSHTLPIRVCAAQRGRDFEAPDLERGTHFRGDF